MSLSVFDLAVNRVLDAEGGYVHDPDDRGGETNIGITARTLREAKDRHLVPRETTSATLCREQAVVIYREMYWRAIAGDSLPPGIAVALFDFGVNSGPGAAIKALQRALRIDADGIVGPATIAAAHHAGDRSIALLGAARLELLANLAQEHGQQKFRRGWFARVVETAVFAGRLSAAARVTEGV